MKGWLSLYLIEEFAGNEKQWSDFVDFPSTDHTLNPHFTFYHKWNWGEHLRSTASETGNQFMRIGVLHVPENGVKKLVGVANCVCAPLRVGGQKYWYIPRGICMEYTDPSVVKDVYEQVKRFFKDTGCALVRFDPNLVVSTNATDEPEVTAHESDLAAVGAIRQLGTQSAAVWPQVERVWIAEIQSAGEDQEKRQLEWLKEHGMRKRLVSQLRKAGREGVQFSVSSEEEDLEQFLRMLNALDERKGGIGKHLDEYYRKQFKLMKTDGTEVLIKAEYQGQVLAMAFMTVFGAEASYLHGASSEEFRNLVGPQFMHFSFMNWLSENMPSVKYYNFWGVISEQMHQKGHPGSGYSGFKRNFGGYEVNYVRAQEFVFKPMSRIVNFFVDKLWAYKNREALGF
ncbi:MAG: peptidoglycan bridge formation glycyltransferase FemA/FemB family protein [Candidatus Ancillula sp.]|nr:peptidoglycan bridge formation glycyltransferase FemA/FemB family protein [Candidatus Ancillula sp.]